MMSVSGLKNPLPITLVLLALVFTSLLPGPAFGSAQRQPTVYISMTDNVFQPQNLFINAGTTLVWTNNGIVPHTSTSDTGLWDSGVLSSGQTYSRRFDAPAIFPYKCVFHRALGMEGTITVLGTQATATSTAAPATSTPTRAPATSTPTPLPPTPTPTRVPPTPTTVSAPPTPTSAPVVVPGVTPAATGTATASPTRPPVVPTPTVLTGTGGSVSDWLPVLALAGLAIVLGLAFKVAARR